MRAYAASSWQTTRAVTLPGALPFFFTGLRIASSLAVISALVAEYFGGPVVGPRQGDHLGGLVEQLPPRLGVRARRDPHRARVLLRDLALEALVSPDAAPDGDATQTCRLRPAGCTSTTAQQQHHTHQEEAP